MADFESKINWRGLEVPGDFTINGVLKYLLNFVHVLLLSKRQKNRRLSGDSFSINLVTSSRKECGITTYSKFLVQELKKDIGVHITYVPKTFALNPYFNLLGWRIGRSLDLVHIQFEYGIFPSLRIGKKTLTAFSALLFYLGLSFGNRRIVTTIHEPRKSITASARSGLLYTKLLDRLIFSTSDAIIIHTEESKRLLQEQYNVNSSKLSIIPHGSYQQPIFLNKEEVKAKFGLQDKKVLTILGFVTPKKGHDLIIPLLPRLNNDVQLVIAGGPQNKLDEQYLRSLKELANNYRCTEKITFTGYLQDLTPILNATDIALLPYRNVTDSGVLHLLIAYKIPTLASDLPAFQEVHKEYGCIDLFKTGDQNDLLQKLQKLFSDQKHQAILQDQCSTMWNDTKWSNIAKKHILLYHEVSSCKR